MASPAAAAAESLGARIAVAPTAVKPALDASLHAENRARLVARLAGAAAPGAVVLLQGGEATTRHETDHEDLFRQESSFHWAFGVREPDCLGAVEVATGRATLFVPRLPDAYRVWMGEIKSTAWWRETYGVDDVRYTDELAAALQGAAGGAASPTLLLLKGLNTDSKAFSKPATFDGIDKFTTDCTSLLWDTLAECRVFKTKKEQELLRYACHVTSEAHMAVMQHLRPGMSEFQLESLFNHWCYYHGGCRFSSYTCICASGHNGSVLHYGHAGQPNAKLIREGDLCLFDMGTEFACYGADITTTFPANGVFTPDQRMVYGAVFAAWSAVLDGMRPGVAWPDLHTVAYRALLAKLKEGGLLVGDVDAMMAPGVNLAATFMPHGLGHFLGIDTHDVGGYSTGGPARPTLAGYASLRTARVLQADMYITVEPGCYFIDHLLDAALADPVKAAFIDAGQLARFRGFGGVRIEDDVLVTPTGCDNFSHAPRTIDDIEGVMAGRITQRAQLTKFH